MSNNNKIIIKYIFKKIFKDFKSFHVMISEKYNSILFDVEEYNNIFCYEENKYINPVISLSKLNFKFSKIMVNYNNGIIYVLKRDDFGFYVLDK